MCSIAYILLIGSEFLYNPLIAEHFFFFFFFFNAFYYAMFFREGTSFNRRLVTFHLFYFDVYGLEKNSVIVFFSYALCATLGVKTKGQEFSVSFSAVLIFISSVERVAV